MICQRDKCMFGKFDMQYGFLYACQLNTRNGKNSIKEQYRIVHDILIKNNIFIL